MRLYPIVVFAALAVCAALAPHRADAMSYVMMRDDVLFDESSGVALFELKSASAVPAMDETRYSLAVLSVISGPPLAASETLALPGFVSKDTRQLYEGVPLMLPGQRVLMFYGRRSDGVLQPMQLNLGMFFPMASRNGEFYSRYLDGSGDVGAGKNAEFSMLRDARRFESWIARRASGHADAADYLITPSSEKYTLIQFNFCNGGNPPPNCQVNFPAGPGRWFQFANNITMQWRAGAEGQTPAMAQDEFALLAAGIAGWVNEPGSLIRMSYAGTGNTCPFVPVQNAPACDPNNANVFWNDPGNQIQGSFNCNGGGTLGFGGSSANSGRQTFNGMQWYPMLIGRLITQDNAGCFFDRNNGTAGIEFFVHEIGHALGFGHSCESGGCSNPVLDAATMRFQLHNDNRGATLGADDVAVAQFVYPDGSPPASANLALDLSATPANIQPGQNITYAIAVSNAGPSAATSVSVSHTRAAALTYVSATGTGWACNNAASTVTCTRASAATGAAPVISVVVSLPGNYAGSTTLASQATVSSAVADPSNANNTDGVNVSVTIVQGRIFANGFE